MRLFNTSEVNQKKLIFTVTTGRTGSNYLAKALGGVEGVTSTHEPEPNFAAYMRRVQHNPQFALQFWEQAKLPAIQAVDTPVYAETSHLACKGFIEPLLSMGIQAPHLISLRRHPREIAISFLERQTIPGRTQHGLMYCRMPTDPLALPFPGWEQASDYQLCYWMALDTELMIQRYKTIYESQGWSVFDCTSRELNDGDIFAKLLDYLGLIDKLTPDLTHFHREISQQQHNNNAKKLKVNDQVLDEEEKAVWDRVKHYAPFLRVGLAKRYQTHV